MAHYTAQLIGAKTWLVLECGYDAIYYLEGDERGLLIDTGVGVGDLKGFIDDNLAAKPYDVLLTHGHLDHVGAIVQFPKVIVNHNDWQLAKDSLADGPRKEFIESMEAMSEGRVPDQDSSGMCRFSGYVPELVDIGEGDVIDLGGRTLEVHCTPGHTEGSICLIDSQENIAIVGDTIIYRLLLLTGPEDIKERMKRWWDATQFLYDGDYKAWYMGHCGIVADSTKAELREIVKILMEDPSKVIYEGTSPKYLLGDTQFYLGFPMSLQ